MPIKKMGRPQAEIDMPTFEKVIKMPLIKADIASILNVSEDTLDNFIKQEFKTTFSALQKQKRGAFRGSVLAKQYELAMKGNVTLLIWLGKQYLEQADKQETKLAASVNTNQETPQAQLERLKDMVKDEK